MWRAKKIRKWIEIDWQTSPLCPVLAAHANTHTQCTNASSVTHFHRHSPTHTEANIPDASQTSLRRNISSSKNGCIVKRWSHEESRLFLLPVCIYIALGKIDKPLHLTYCLALWQREAMSLRTATKNQNSKSTKTLKERGREESMLPLQRTWVDLEKSLALMGVPLGLLAFWLCSDNRCSQNWWYDCCDVSSSPRPQNPVVVSHRQHKGNIQVCRKNTRQEYLIFTGSRGWKCSSSFEED